MRGVISAGMALALDELGLVPAFDAVYGASAGAITGAWLLSRPEGLLGWAEPAYARTLIRRSALLRGRPVADIRALIEDLYQTTFPMDFAAVLANPIELHPLATDAATGQSTDLRPFIATPADLRLALRASAAMPLLAGPPVALANRRFYDAGVSESVPYRTALAQGATHVLVLRSRRALRPAPAAPTGSRPPRRLALVPSGSRRRPVAPEGRAPDQSGYRRLSRRLLARTTLRRETPALRAAFLARESRLAADDQLLAQYESAPRPDSPAPPRPAVFSIRPAAGLTHGQPPRHRRRPAASRPRVRARRRPSRLPRRARWRRPMTPRPERAAVTRRRSSALLAGPRRRAAGVVRAHDQPRRGVGRVDDVVDARTTMPALSALPHS